MSHKIFQVIELKVYVQEIRVDGKRVLAFFAPSRPIGKPVSSRGNYHYPARLGESLVEMDTATLQQIFNETEPDYSAESISGLSLNDLDKVALKKFRSLWAIKSGRKDFKAFGFDKTLRSLKLVSDRGLSIVAIILFGKEQTIDKYMPDAEIVFEWRQEESKINFDYRNSWRGPFMLLYEEIWKQLDARNIRYAYQAGFIQRELKAFDEKPFREALMNAVIHRDYRMRGHSVFIKASPNDIRLKALAVWFLV